MGLRGPNNMFGSRLSDESEATPEETQDVLPNDKDGTSPYSARRQKTKGFGFFFWVIMCFNAILFPLSVACAVSAFRWKYALQHNHGNAFLRLTSWYSPVFDQTQIGIVDKRVNGSILNLDNSIFRRAPSPEVDEAWERISSLMPHVISTDDFVRLGKYPLTTARFAQDWGFGPEVHVAELDVLHTIHCVNAIRRDVH
ncbi:hypothetical protein CcaCcLH18_12209 [Colletotrichum camelliae]|nr:hypothetical protein CcaCcLH18_12209 [Colletotrichum camelliae]